MLPMKDHAVTFDSTIFTQYFDLLKNSSTNISWSSISNFTSDKFKIGQEIGPSELELREDVNKLMDRVSSQNISNSRTMFVEYVYFIKNHNFGQLCDKLYDLSENSWTSNTTLWRFDEDKLEHNEVGIKIEVNSTNEKELQYAFYLCDLNEHVVKPSLELLSQKFDKKLDQSNFNRFFSLHYPNGKSIHDVSDILSIKTHYPKLKYEFGKKGVKVREAKENKCTACGYTGHFREILDNSVGVYTEEYFNITKIYFDWFFFDSIYQIAQFT